MSSELDRYLEAATRANTRRSYASSLRHFEEEWGGVLPASADTVAHYIARYGEQLASNTLRQRLTAIGRWHIDHGFVDPTRDPLVRRTLRGVRAVHGAAERQARPLQLDELAAVVQALDEILADGSKVRLALRASRDKALVLVGFWRAFRGDELIRLSAEHVKITPGQGVTLFLPRSKSDRENAGKTFAVPALSRLCPVQALQDWLERSGVTEGPVFRAINRWGQISSHGIHPNSLIKLLRRILGSAPTLKSALYSTHSLRRGLAGWASSNGWEVKALMNYVGWRDVNSALRYIDAADTFDGRRLEAGMATAPQLPAPAVAQRQSLELRMTLQSYAPRGAGLKGARAQIEKTCLARHGAKALDDDGTRYGLWFAEQDEQLDELLAGLLDEIHRVADNHRCYLEASIRDPASGKRWE